jgi:hypothetical protein
VKELDVFSKNPPIFPKKISGRGNSTGSTGPKLSDGPATAIEKIGRHYQTFPARAVMSCPFTHANWN